jgi:hypothetical protein
LATSNLSKKKEDIPTSFSRLSSSAISRFEETIKKNKELIKRYEYKKNSFRNLLS